ncbi:MAG: hypothetical protein V4611_04810 [Patescibacteria group bacterium]
MKTREQLRLKRLETLKRLAEEGTGLEQVAILKDELKLFTTDSAESLCANLKRAINVFLPVDLQTVARCGLGFDGLATGISFEDRLQLAAIILLAPEREIPQLWDKAIDEVVTYYELARRINLLADHALAEDDRETFIQLVRDLTAGHRYE